MEDIPTKTKIIIIQKEIEILKNTLYNFSIQIRVAEKVNDEQMKKNNVAQMVKLEKMKDEYEVILQELEEKSKPDL